MTFYPSVVGDLTQQVFNRRHPAPYSTVDELNEADVKPGVQFDPAKQYVVLRGDRAKVTWDGSSWVGFPVEAPKKPKRKRRTKAEMEAARAAEAETAPAPAPVDPEPEVEEEPEDGDAVPDPVDD